MANTLRVKRRAAGGAAGAPATLENAELAFNEVDEILYYGKGTGGAGGSATSIIPIGGPGAFARKHSPAFTGTPEAPTASDVTNNTQIATTAFVQNAVAAKAPLASPALTGIPTAPTAATSTNTMQLATTAFVKAVVSDLVGGAGAALDTLDELAAAIGDDPNFATTLTTLVGEKLAKAANLADLPNVATARANLQLLSMALQAASNVAITGGTINGIDLDGGTF